MIVFEAADICILEVFPRGIVGQRSKFYSNKILSIVEECVLNSVLRRNNCMSSFDDNHYQKKIEKDNSFIYVHEGGYERMKRNLSPSLSKSF
jgi:hypothetical protein